MAITALIASVRTNLVEPTASFWTDAEIISWFNESQKDIAIKTKCLESIKSYSAVLGQMKYALPADCLKNGIKAILYKTLYKLRQSSFREWHIWQTSGPVSSGDPITNYFYEEEGTNKYFHIYPMCSANAPTTTISGDITGSVTSITLVSTASLEDWGRIIIDNEVISYDYKDSTKIYSCTRGAEGTTAATHSSGATATKREFIVYFYRIPPDLADATSTTLIPSEFQRLMIFYATAHGWLKAGKNDKAQPFFDLYDRELEEFAVEETVGGMDRLQHIVDEELMMESDYGIV